MSRAIAERLSTWESMKFGYFSTERDPWVAACLYAQSSGFSKSTYYLQAFVLPLFVPTTFLYFDFGSRVGGGWEGVSPELLKELDSVVPPLLNEATVESVAARASEVTINLYHLEVAICASILRDEPARLPQLRAIARGWQTEVAWEAEVLGRCIATLDALARDGRESVLTNLRRCRDEVLTLLRES